MLNIYFFNCLLNYEHNMIETVFIMINFLPGLHQYIILNRFIGLVLLL